jgi:RNA polymerase sigma-70 factor (ECF subfamily)
MTSGQPADNSSPEEAFEAHRRLLFTIAYEMLASTADAEDVVQDTWLRWCEVDPSQVHHPRAYLARIATRLSLNRLRAIGRRRETYVGPWLPEPLLTTGDVADDAVLAEAVSGAVMVVLETLTPSERAAFVLREVFDFDYAEIGRILDKAPATVRQITHRARSHVRARRPRVPVDAGTHGEVLDRFLAAAAGQDLAALLTVLAPDVVLLADSGGAVSSARRPVHGADSVARLVIGLARREVGAVVRRAEVNGRPGVLVSVDGAAVDSVLTVTVDAGRVAAVHIVRNPDKLRRLVPRRLARR